MGLCAQQVQLLEDQEWLQNMLDMNENMCILYVT